jgi:DNA-directed RNA polymerase III subunit RPC1
LILKLNCNFGFTGDFEFATGGKYVQLDPTVEILNPLVVSQIFERITKDDSLFLMMGFDHFSATPLDLIVRRIPVPPICIRPSVMSEIKAGT